MVTLSRKCSYYYRIPGFDSQAFPPFEIVGKCQHCLHLPTFNFLNFDNFKAAGNYVNHIIPDECQEHVYHNIDGPFAKQSFDIQRRITQI